VQVKVVQTPTSSSSSASASSSSVKHTPSAEAIANAQKCAKFAASSLQFDDIPYAIANLQQALSLLTGKKYD